MRPPIVCIERGSAVDVFASISAVENYIESIDVANGEFVFYDADGLVLRGEVSERATAFARGRLKRLERWRLVIAEPPERRPDELAVALRRFLRSINPKKKRWTDDWIDQAPIASLVLVASGFVTG